jgi:hypothetical protein
MRIAYFLIGTQSKKIAILLISYALFFHLLALRTPIHVPEIYITPCSKVILAARITPAQGTKERPFKSERSLP